MTVGQLIAALLVFPQDLKVVIDDVDYGLGEVSGAKVIGPDDRFGYSGMHKLKTVRSAVFLESDYESV